MYSSRQRQDLVVVLGRHAADDALEDVRLSQDDAHCLIDALQRVDEAALPAGPSQVITALGAAYAELWATYGDTERVRPLFEQIDAALKAALPAGPSQELRERILQLPRYSVKGTVIDHAEGYRNERRDLIELDRVLSALPAGGGARQIPKEDQKDDY
jgi:hypothetical protein